MLKFIARIISPIFRILGYRSQAMDLYWYATHGSSRYNGRPTWPLGIYRRGVTDGE